MNPFFYGNGVKICLLWYKEKWKTQSGHFFLHDVFWKYKRLNEQIRTKIKRILTSNILRQVWKINKAICLYNISFCEISGSHSTKYLDDSLLGRIQCRVVSLKKTNVPEMCTGSTNTLMIEAACISETLVYFSKTIQCCILKCCHLQHQRQLHFNYTCLSDLSTLALKLRFLFSYVSQINWLLWFIR
jgi:hypothetical protein